MPVLINFKICDNAEECNGIAACSTKALFWDEGKKTIKIDNSKCISCGKCEKVCEVQAIKVAKDDDEYKQFEEEINADPRKVSDLYLDRYGAQPILPAFLIEESKFEQEVKNAHKLCVAELFTSASIQCMLKSIPMTDLLDGLDIKYRKVHTMYDNLANEFLIKDYPALLFFDSGQLIGKIEGYYGLDKKNILKEKINQLLSDSTN